MTLLENNIRQTTGRSGGYVPEGAIFDQAASDAREDIEDLRIETAQHVKKFAKYLVSELANLHTLPSDPDKKYVGYDKDNKQFPLDAQIYAAYVGKNSASEKEDLKYPIRIGGGGRRKLPLPSLQAYGKEVWPISLTIERRANMWRRLGSEDGLLVRDIVARLDYPHNLTSENLEPKNFGKSDFRYAFSTDGQLNGLWRTSQHFDDKMGKDGIRRREFLNYQGQMDRYTRGYVEALGNACIVAESVDVLFGGDRRPSDHIDIDVQPYVQSFSELADAWLSQSTFHDYRQGYPLTLFASTPIGFGYDNATYRIGQHIPSVPVPLVH